MVDPRSPLNSGGRGNLALWFLLSSILGGRSVLVGGDWDLLGLPLYELFELERLGSDIGGCGEVDACDLFALAVLAVSQVLVGGLCVVSGSGAVRGVGRCGGLSLLSDPKG